MSADSAKQFIQEQLELTVSDLVDKKIDEALDKKSVDLNLLILQTYLTKFPRRNKYNGWKITIHDN